jgi:hypothetical protein
MTELILLQIGKNRKRKQDLVNIGLFHQLIWDNSLTWSSKGVTFFEDEINQTKRLKQK